jgi:NADH-quinone oxidoreductase subunit J
MVELIVFFVSAAIILGGAVGVIISKNPVHAALSLVATLFGVAVVFIAKEANFLAAVQVIVYTGAVVVLILFVLMLLGVDRAENLSVEPIAGQRFLAVVVGLALLVMVGSVLLVPVLRDDNASVEDTVVTGERSATAPLVGTEDEAATDALDQFGLEAQPAVPDEDADQSVADADPSGMARIGEVLFTDYVFAFEVTAAMLTIAVVAGVLMARKPSGYEPLPEDDDLAERDDESDDEEVDA